MTRLSALFTILLLIPCLGAWAQPGIQDYCLDPTLAEPLGLSDLYCVNLVAIPSLTEASGYARLVPIDNPFGVAVDRDGHHEYNLRIHFEGLPAPAELGPYSAYVAWVTTPFLHPFEKLGVVENGETRLGEVGFNKFLVMITAEASSGVTERAGKIVMRGSSPSNRMEAHDLAQTAPLAVFSSRSPEESGHAGHVMRAMDGWKMPPMHPEIVMPPGMHGIEPSVAPYRVSESPGQLPSAIRRKHVVLEEGDEYDLRTGYVTRTIAGQGLTMMGFNRQYPGPLLDVKQESEITVNFQNGLQLPSAIHWHGLRLDYRFDGVPGLTQDLVQPGESFDYRLKFPDPGIYWFHPHHREDIQMDLGLYANILVRSTDPNYYSPVNREESWMLDDLLLDDAGVTDYGSESSNYMLMGRFGNTLMINGETDYTLETSPGETVRLFITNSSNTRTYNLSIAGQQMKLVGSDVGKFEREEWIESLVIATAERYIVEVQFDESGEYPIENRVQAINHGYGVFFPEIDTLGFVRVAGDPVEQNYGEEFRTLRVNEDVVADIDSYRDEFDRPIDYELAVRLEVDSLPAVVQQLMRFDAVYFNPVEWSGTMPMMNWATSGKEVRWILEDTATGRQNMDIQWRFQAGDVVKIRLVNERDAFHAMQHPIHFHGQRFLVLERDGEPNKNLVWKDTTILPAGSTADILLELSNPGLWMAHCHIAEHIDSGMMFTFVVD